MIKNIHIYIEFETPYILVESWQGYSKILLVVSTAFVNSSVIPTKLLLVMIKFLIICVLYILHIELVV